MFEKLLIISISAVLVNNFLLSRFLGVCPFLGVSKRLSSSVGMGFAVIFVLTLSNGVTTLINNYFLVPYDMVFLQNVIFVLVIASLVQIVELVIKKVSPPLHQALGIYLPLITTNCAILGAALIAAFENYTFVESTVMGFSAGVGFLLAILLMSGIRERLDIEGVPRVFKGTTIAFIVAALLSLSFLGFSGMIVE